MCVCGIYVFTGDRKFDDVVVLVVVFFSLLFCSIGFQIFGNLKDIPLI